MHVGLTPPPIPPRLRERNLVGAVEEAAPVAAAAPATSGGDDLGFLDVQVSSAQEIEQEQTQANKMANIMGAFGSTPQAAPMPGMGAPNAFGSAVNNMGMQQPGMVNQVSNNMMNSMAPMGGAPQTTMSMGGFGGAPAPTPQPGFGAPAATPQPGFGGAMGGMGGMGSMGQPPAAQPAMGGGLMAPMTTPTTPTSPTSTSNAANAMPKKDDPFASLGALTGIAPKAAPAKAPTMNEQQQNQFNNYMQNNVGAPAAPSNNNSMDIFG